MDDPRPVFAILHHGKQCVEVGVEFPDGSHQVVRYSWLSRERTPIPADWWDGVLKEIRQVAGRTPL